MNLSMAIGSISIRVPLDFFAYSNASPALSRLVFSAATRSLSDGSVPSMVPVALLVAPLLGSLNALAIHRNDQPLR